MSNVRFGTIHMCMVFNVDFSFFPHKQKAFSCVACVISYDVIMLNFVARDCNDYKWELVWS